MPRYNWAEILGDDSATPKDAASIRAALESSFDDYHSSSTRQRAMVAQLIEATRREERARVARILEGCGPLLARIAEGQPEG